MDERLGRVKISGDGDVPAKSWELFFEGKAETLRLKSERNLEIAKHLRPGSDKKATTLHIAKRQAELAAILESRRV